MKHRARRACWIAIVCLALSLLTTGGNVGAATPAQERQMVVRYFRFLALTQTIPPLDAAVLEATILNCMYNYNPEFAEDRRSPLAECSKYIPLALLPLFQSVNNLYNLPGTWSTVDYNIGNKQQHFGAITIDSKNMGRLVSSESGYAILQFYQDDSAVDTSIFGPDAVVVTFDYIHYVGNTRNDAGYGALIMSPSGCRMYGKFYSTSDPSTLGTLLLARC